MKTTLLVALRATAVTIALTGIVYPLAVWAIAQAAFARTANGSFIAGEDGVVVGSELIGQAFESPAYLRPRPSAAGAGYDGAASGGSNLGPTSKALRDRATTDAARLVAANPNAPGPVPADLVTASGSGLDPHLSPGSARWQVPRIAAARGLPEDRVRAVIEELAEGRDLGVLGEPRVNVLTVNLALDRRFGRPAPRANMPGK